MTSQDLFTRAMDALKAGNTSVYNACMRAMASEIRAE